jgi:hypothetical protein
VPGCRGAAPLLSMVCASCASITCRRVAAMQFITPNEYVVLCTNDERRTTVAELPRLVVTRVGEHVERHFHPPLCGDCMSLQFKREVMHALAASPVL